MIYSCETVCDRKLEKGTPSKNRNNRRVYRTLTPTQSERQAYSCPTWGKVLLLNQLIFERTQKISVVVNYLLLFSWFSLISAHATIVNTGWFQELFIPVFRELCQHTWKKCAIMYQIYDIFNGCYHSLEGWCKSI